MDVLPGLRRLRTRIHAMERGLKTLRNEVESILLDYDDDTGIELDRINCGLSRLLGSADDIPLTETQPYAEFADGIWCSFDQNVPGTSLLVSTRTLSRTDPRAEGGQVSRICVHPVFTTSEKPLWCTLEFVIDPDMFKAAKAIRIDFSCFFEIPSGATVPLPSSCKFQVRLREGEEIRDAADRHFPVTTMSFDHSIELTAKTMADMKAEGAEAVFGIVTLPQSGAYTFNVERFNIYALNG